jgi:mannobiose 2-epimerase
VIDPAEVRAVHAAARSYLADVLLPFWMLRAPDPPAGGFLTYFDRNGERTGETAKTLLMQVRMLWSMSAAHRAGYGGGKCADLARAGADFLFAHYQDDEHGGWYWIADRDGNPTVTAKIGYGQCFAIHAFAEYFLATGDERGREAMLRTHRAIRTHMADRVRGGYYEIMQRDWLPAPGGRRGGDRKSFDVHMHVMEALTSLYQVTGEPEHRAELFEVIRLICTRMLEREHGTGVMQFALDFTPLPAIRFEVEWGTDEQPAGGAFPIDTTSYGHNVECAWLLLRAADALGLPQATFAEPCRRLFEHCLLHGIDWQLGGVYLDGAAAGPPRNTSKQFWQQAETLVGMLAAWELSGEDRYWRAFRCVFDFVFAKFVHLAGGGEWFAWLERDGTPRDDRLGTAWKINYHTVRAMLEVERRLRSHA